MNIETGEVRPLVEVPEDELQKWVPVVRDLTAKEKMEHQIRLYSPCACGSGKKFKFCCKK